MKRVNCDKCQGRGRVSDGAFDEMRCPKCNGHGYLEADTCSQCNGSGHGKPRAKP